MAIPLEEITMEKALSCTDEFIAGIASPALKIIYAMINCGSLTDSSLESLKSTSMEVLHIEGGKNITDKGIFHLSSLRLHTFYVSQSEHLTEKRSKLPQYSFYAKSFFVLIAKDFL